MCVCVCVCVCVRERERVRSMGYGGAGRKEGDRQGGDCDSPGRSLHSQILLAGRTDNATKKQVNVRY